MHVLKEYFSLILVSHNIVRSVPPWAVCSACDSLFQCPGCFLLRLYIVDVDGFITVLIVRREYYGHDLGFWIVWLFMFVVMMNHFLLY